MTDLLLKFDQVTFSYGRGGAPALDAVSLDLPSGSVTALLGPIGAGKSTLLFLSLGWLHPRSGRIFLFGRPLTDYTRGESGRQMALVPQREHITFEYSVLEYVLLGRMPHLAPLSQPGRSDYAVASGALERVGLAEFAGRPVQSLSGGELQLVLIARALAQQPRLLLLDEPTSHLDLHNKVNLAGLIRSLNRDGVSVILTTHDPELAGAVASHVALLDRGRLLRVGPSPETLTADYLTSLYHVPLEVIEAHGRKVILW